jgi:hypothetical protein
MDANIIRQLQMCTSERETLHKCCVKYMVQRKRKENEEYTQSQLHQFPGHQILLNTKSGKVIIGRALIKDK